MKRLSLRITGQVQGVGYRYSTVRQAQRLGLLGWVRNTSDGAVELVAEGNAPDLQRLLAWCRSGPPGARVNAIDEQWGPASGEFRTFETRR